MSGAAQTVDEILAEREVRGLRVPVIGRILLACYGLVSLLILSTGNALPPAAMATAFALVLTMGGLNVAFLLLLRRRRHVGAVGLAGAAFDVVFCLGQIPILQQYGETADLPVGVIFMSEAPAFFVMVTVVNALALRPRYPLMITAGATLALAWAAAMTLTDPRTVLSTDPRQVFREGGLDPTQMVNVMVLICGIGLVISYITHIARQTIRHAIEGELERAQLEREQLRVVMREKVQGLAGLVAGVSHEINSPIGVIKSGVDTLQRAIDKLEQGADARDDGRALGVARSTLGAMATAAERVEKTETSLRALAHLDEGDFQKVELPGELDRVIEAVQREKGDGVAVEKQYGDVPALHLNARELTQALLTIVQNAFEAIDGGGTVTVSTGVEPDGVRIRIRDTGRGIPTEKIATLFDVGLKARDERMAAGFGLPAAMSIVQRHGGHIDVASAVGEGSTFDVWLPAPAEQP